MVKQPCMAIGMKTTLLKRTMQISIATVYTNENKALLVIANWTDLPQKAKISIDEKALGFHPATISLPEIRDIQWGSRLNNLEQCEIMGRSGMIILLEK